MATRLYNIPGSHPAAAVEGMLSYKGIEYRRRDLFPVLSKVILRALGFPGVTVPALKLDGRRVQGSRAISRALDQVKPDPPLFPADPEARAAVEEAERFGDEELQHPLRQLSWWALKEDPAPLRSFSEGARLGIPIGLAVKTAAPIVALSAHYNRANPTTARAALAALPGLLDRVDGLIAAGTIGNPRPNAADFQIAASLRLAMTFQDLRPAIDARPAGEMARRVIPVYPGDIPPIIPAEWMAGLSADGAAAAV